MRRSCLSKCNDTIHQCIQRRKNNNNGEKLRIYFAVHTTKTRTQKKLAANENRIVAQKGQRS